VRAAVALAFTGERIIETDRRQLRKRWLQRLKDKGEESVEEVICRFWEEALANAQKHDAPWDEVEPHLKKIISDALADYADNR
jgi:hypothetical protein